MHRIVWAAAIILAATLAGGCASNKKTEDENANKSTGPVEPSALAAAKARYADIALVGEVEDADEPFAVVAGIDKAALKPQDVIHFIDVSTDTTVAQGFLSQYDASGGRIVVKFVTDQRAPRKGDLAVKRK